MNAGRAWLFKSEASVFSITDLQKAPGRRTFWNGVRNYQVRNFFRDTMHPGDRILYYHSSSEPTGVAGLARVVSEGYPDPTAFDRKDHGYDPKSDRGDPTWYGVDIEHVETFPGVVTLAELKATPGLARMMVVQRGSRLSVQPVSEAEYAIVVALVRRAGRAQDRKTGISGEGGP